MCGVLCGLDRLQDIAAYGEENFSFPQETFGINKNPSASTLTRIMNMADGEKAADVIINIMRKSWKQAAGPQLLAAKLYAPGDKETGRNFIL
jgi:hypothetical protein